MSVEEILAGTTSAQISGWMAYFDHVVGRPEPWSETAAILAEMRNLWAAGRRRWTPADFLPVRRERRVQTAAEMMATVEGIGRRIEAQRGG